MVAIFTRRSLPGEALRIYGDGTQTRDLLYVEDCARFVCDALVSDAATGPDPQCRHRRGRLGERARGADRARPDADPRTSTHIHPQSEIAVLRCDPRLAAEVLGWRPQVDLEDGLARVRAWMAIAARPRASRSHDGVAIRLRLAIDGGTPVRSTLLPYAHQ